MSGPSCVLAEGGLFHGTAIHAVALLPIAHLAMDLSLHDLLVVQTAFLLGVLAKGGWRALVRSRRGWSVYGTAILAVALFERGVWGSAPLVGASGILAWWGGVQLANALSLASCDSRLPWGALTGVKRSHRKVHPFAGACEGFGCLSRLATRGGERRPVGLPLSRYFPLVKPLWGLVGIAFAFLLASCRADTWSILVLGLALLWQSHYPSHACPPGTSQHSVCLSSRKLLCCHLEYSCSWLGPSLAKPLSLAACMPLACFH